MAVLVLGAKAAIAVLLLVAGGAKLADLPGFATAVRLFVPARAGSAVLAAVRSAAVAIAVSEVLVGTISLCWPAVGLANPVVLTLAAGFAVVAGLGYAWHRDRPCRCFGALTRRRFGLRSLLQALLITVGAALAARPVRSADLRLAPAVHLLLLAAAAIMVLAAYTAARALAMGETRLGMAG